MAYIRMMPTFFIHPMSDESNSESGLAPLSYEEASKIVGNDEFIEALRDVVVEAIGSVMPAFSTPMDVLIWSSCYEQYEVDWTVTDALARVVKADQDINRNLKEWHPTHQDALISLFFREKFDWDVKKLAPYLAESRIGVTAINYFATDTHSTWLCIITNCKMTLFRHLYIPNDVERDDRDVACAAQPKLPSPRDENGRFTAARPKKALPRALTD